MHTPFRRKLAFRLSAGLLALWMGVLTPGVTVYAHYCKMADRVTVAIEGGDGEKAPKKNCCNGEEGGKTDKEKADKEKAEAEKAAANGHGPQPKPAAVKSANDCCSSTHQELKLKETATPTQKVAAKDSARAAKPKPAEADPTYAPLRSNFEIDALMRLFDFISNFFEEYLPSSRAGGALIRLYGVFRI